MERSEIYYITALPSSWSAPGAGVGVKNVELDWAGARQDAEPTGSRIEGMETARQELMFPPAAAAAAAIFSSWLRCASRTVWINSRSNSTMGTYMTSVRQPVLKLPPWKHLLANTFGCMTHLQPPKELTVAAKKYQSQSFHGFLLAFVNIVGAHYIWSMCDTIPCSSIQTWPIVTSKTFCFLLAQKKRINRQHSVWYWNNTKIWLQQLRAMWKIILIELADRKLH